MLPAKETTVEERKKARPRVLIVGGGPAGLACAIELGSRGIACLLIKRIDRFGHATRAQQMQAAASTFSGLSSRLIRTQHRSGRGPVTLSSQASPLAWV